MSIGGIPIQRPLIDYSVRIGADALSSAQIVDLCRRFAAVGIRRIMFNMSDMHEIEPLRIVGKEVVPQVADFPDASDIGN